MQAPITQEMVNTYPYYGEISKVVEDIALEEGVPYFDFTHDLPLRTEEHYYDHLNVEGVKIFNHALIDSLDVHGIYNGLSR